MGDERQFTKIVLPHQARQLKFFFILCPHDANTSTVDQIKTIGYPTLLEDYCILWVLDLLQFRSQGGQFVLSQAIEEVDFLEERDSCGEFDRHGYRFLNKELLFTGNQQAQIQISDARNRAVCYA